MTQAETRWDGDPKLGTKWRRRGLRVETRHVTDRTFGGDVYFVSGRYYSAGDVQRCTLQEWEAWVCNAKEVK